MASSRQTFGSYLRVLLILQSTGERVRVWMAGPLLRNCPPSTSGTYLAERTVRAPFGS